MSSNFSRRSFLKGVGGTMLTLPFFEAALERQAHAATAPTRYLVLFAGMSAGREGGPNHLKPGAFGNTYTPTAGLQPLVTRGVQANVSVVGNLKIPRGAGNAGSAPGGVGSQWHGAVFGPLLSGQRLVDTGNVYNPVPAGPTSDQIVAGALGTGVGLHYNIQASIYRTDDDPRRGYISARKNGNSIVQNTPVVSALQAYNSLITNITPSSSSGPPMVDHTALRRKSAIDLALGRKDLAAKLGAADKQRLERHFDELRTFENGLAAIPTATVGGQCQLPTQPSDATTVSDGYANEALRGPLLIDLIKTAFVCNTTRVATLGISYEQTYMNCKNLIPSKLSAEAHQTSHSGGMEQAHTEVIAWHVDQFAQLVAKFKATTDVDGRTLLDNTAIVMMFAGGYGLDPIEGITGPHSGDNMAILTAGLANGKAGGGKHLDAGGVHPISVALTAANNVLTADGKPALTAMNEITTDVPAIRRV